MFANERKTLNLFYFFILFNIILYSLYIYLYGYFFWINNLKMVLEIGFNWFYEERNIKFNLYI